jgi:AcrR family transcriptional regulator
MPTSSASRTRRSREERERIVLDTAARLFYARGVHEVGMDELVRETGLGKATVYRLYPTKDALVAAYLRRLQEAIFALIDRDADRAESPREALRAILHAVGADLRRPEFRGCAFNNASIEYDDPRHPARSAARDYRAGLLERLRHSTRRLLPSDQAAADVLARRLAVLIDGAYVSTVHLGPDGPATEGLALAYQLIDQAAPVRTRQP